MSTRFFFSIILFVMFLNGIIISSTVVADNHFNGPPIESGVDEIDWFKDRILRKPPNGYIACAQIFSTKEVCYFGVAKYCSTNPRNKDQCNSACDAIGNVLYKKSQCQYGCLAADLYSC